MMKDKDDDPSRSRFYKKIDKYRKAIEREKLEKDIKDNKLTNEDLDKIQ